MDRRTRAALLAGASLALGALSSTARGRRIDAGVFGAVNGGHGGAADRLFSGVTELGSLWASGAAAGVLSTSGHRRAAARSGAAALAAWLAGQGLKRAVNRSRPYDADPDGTRLMIGRPRAASWPSSHPAVLGAFAATASRDLGLRRGWRSALWLLTTVVGVSRVYLGVHYPSDVASGMLMGAAIADLTAPHRR